MQKDYFSLQVAQTKNVIHAVKQARKNILGP